MTGLQVQKNALRGFKSGTRSAFDFPLLFLRIFFFELVESLFIGE